MGEIRGALNQSRLSEVLHNIFLGREILENTRKANIVSVKTGSLLELDYWIPDLKIGFEYQDPHHYTTTWYANNTVSSTQAQDVIKKEFLDARGDTLVVVPCWWDGKKESLAATIQQRRPELVSHIPFESEPIPPDPPPGYFEVKKIPGFIGELMLPSFADTSSNVDFTNWWFSEKYDGVRVLWNHVDNNLYSKSGKLYKLPVIFRRDLPPIVLDGEIWFGRESLRDALDVISASNSNSKFHFLRFLWFDSPNRNDEFESRYGSALRHVPSSHPISIVVVCMQNLNKIQFHKFTNQIIAQEGEGSILREPHSLYQSGRSDSFFKFKASRDQEALVIDTVTGGFLLKLPNDVTFESQIPKSGDAVEIGNIVTFSYEGYLKNGEPKNPQNFVVRTDLTWDDVLFSFVSQDLKKSSSIWLSNVPRQVAHGHWTKNEGAKTKEFFDEFSRMKGMDPLVPENWYKITCNEIMQANKGASVLSHFGGSVIKALLHVYPNIGLDERKFSNKSRNYWLDTEKRKRFFDEYAAKYKFDPNIAKNWYLISRKSVMKEKDAVSVLYYYSGSLVTAIVNLYPSLHLNPAKFKINRRRH